MEYDIIIIGSGAAGHTLALFLSKIKKYKVCLIEKDIKKFGGICLNEGCIPLKGFLHFAGKMDYFSLKENILKKVEVLRNGLLSRIKNSGIDIIEGKAEFINNYEVKVNNKILKGKNIVIATGSYSRRLFNFLNVYSSDKIFEMDFFPKKVVIIGGGVAGCEFASFFNKMGTEVSIIEVMNSLLYGFDKEAARTLEREFKKLKIKVFTNAKIQKIKNKKIIFNVDGDLYEEDFDIAFELTGRIPQIKDLHLENTGVEIDKKGYIKVNEYLQTSQNHIYAIGDCIYSPMLAYTASHEAQIVFNNITGNKTKINYKNLPFFVFSYPQIGFIGEKEEDIKENIDYKIYKYFFKAIGKSFIEDKNIGFLKLIVNKNIIKGGVIVGEDVVDTMNFLSFIIQNEIPVDKIKKSFFIHPSISEIIKETIEYGKN